MARLTDAQEKLLQRIRRSAEEVAAMERHILNEVVRDEALSLVASMKSDAVPDERIEQHLRDRIFAPHLTPAQRSEGADELPALLRRYAH